MRLYLVRHAKAVDRDTGLPEHWRYLTEIGRERFREAARKLARKGIAPQIVFTSPLTRCVQTAEILAAALRFPGPVAVSGELSPGFDRSGLTRLLAGQPVVGEIALVGHEPDLSDLAEALLGTGETILLKKGDVIALDVDPDFAAPARFAWRTSKGKFVDRI